MKTVFAILVFFAGCKSPFKKNTKDFIPGIYVRMIDHEFAKGGDTLVITRISGNTYQIVKRSGFVRIRNGQQQPIEQQTENWTGIYDEEKQVIYEQQKERLLSFAPDENVLRVGASVYTKVTR